MTETPQRELLADQSGTPDHNNCSLSNDDSLSRVQKITLCLQMIACVAIPASVVKWFAGSLLLPWSAFWFWQVFILLWGVLGLITVCQSTRQNADRGSLSLLSIALRSLPVWIATGAVQTIYADSASLEYFRTIALCYLLTLLMETLFSVRSITLSKQAPKRLDESVDFNNSSAYRAS